MATRYRFSIEAFERIFAGVANVELLEGEVFQMSPVGSRHVFKVMQLSKLFSERLGQQVVVSTQNPLRLPSEQGGSEPQPDLVLLRPPIEQYRDRIPQASDALLVVEVSDSTLEYDQTTKQGVYARAGVPEYWVVNLVGNVLEVYQQPGPQGYQIRHEYGPEQPIVFMGQALDW